MPDQLQLRGGTTVQHSTFTGASKEVTVDTTKKTVVVHDGSTAGGNPMLREDASNSALALGSAGTPSLKFTGDTNTGIYSPGADQVAISTGGSGRLFVGSAGDVGIGGSPSGSYKLEVKAGAIDSAALFDSTNAVGPHIRFSTSGTDRHYLGSAPGFTAGGTSSDFAIRTAGYFEILTGGNNPRLRVTSAGLVGIGTSSPSSLLHLSVATAASDGTKGVRITNPAGTAAMFECGSSNDSYVGTTSGSDFSIRTNNTSRIYVTNGGNVGIGVTPSYKLHVDNGTTTDAAYLGNGYGGLVFGCNSSGERIINTNASGPIVFQRGGTETARIDSSSRLLVGTSSTSANTRIVAQGNSFAAGSNGRIDIDCDVATPANDDFLGALVFGDNSQSNGAWVAAQRDGGTWSASSKPSRLVFSTTADGASSPTERMRITNSGFAKFSNTGSYKHAVTTSRYEFRSNQNDVTFNIVNSNASPSATSLGCNIYYDAASPNNTGCEFLYCEDSTALRASIRSNGGLANYSANNANLSDRNAKKDISPAAGTWDCIKEWEIVNYRYKDQPDDADLNLGVIAQQVAESCPEVITVFEEAKDDQPEKLGIKEQQMYWMAIKALQEAQVRIEQLEAKVAALESA